MSLASDDDIRKTFDDFDADGNGWINTKEVKQCLLQLGLEEADAAAMAEVLCTEADTNCDGKVTFDEFKKALAKMAAE